MYFNSIFTGRYRVCSRVRVATASAPHASVQSAQLFRQVAWVTPTKNTARRAARYVEANGLANVLHAKAATMMMTTTTSLA